MDDILINGSSIFVMNGVKTFLRDNFLLKDLGTTKFFLGLELSKSSHGI